MKPSWNVASHGRLFSVGQAPALVFVMDTTGSMFEEITAARLRAHSIIQSRASSSREPSSYVLVPFHDPSESDLLHSIFRNQVKTSLEAVTSLPDLAGILVQRWDQCTRLRIQTSSCSSWRT